MQILHVQVCACRRVERDSFERERKRMVERRARVRSSIVLISDSDVYRRGIRTEPARDSDVL
jgi:hypothetical protein